MVACIKSSRKYKRFLKKKKTKENYSDIHEISDGMTD